jgi:nickel/cobalt transporter (NicO) family protein
LILATALFLGFLHGLGADHLMAIAALTVDGSIMTASARRTRALGIAVRFATGHAVLLGLGTGLIVIAGWTIPAVVERGGELLGGALLVVMGGLAVGGIFSGRVYGHTHSHGREPQPHWHLHVGRRERHPRRASHSHLPTIVGAAFAISSLRALAMLTPFGAHLGAEPLPLLIALIGLFAVGILLSMSLFGVALARILSAHALERVGQAAGMLVGLSSIVLGAAWIVTA